MIRRPTMTIEQFLDWEDRQEERYEFNGFEPVLMAGGSEEQADIQANIIAVLHARLRGNPCRVVGSDLKIRVAGRIRYPDAFVLCSPRVPGRKVVADPVIVFEVLSPSSEDTDLFEKNEEYRATESIQRYVVLQQTSIAALVFSRAADGSWPSTVLTGPDAMLDLAEIGERVPLGDFYAGMELMRPAPAPPADAVSAP